MRTVRIFFFFCFFYKNVVFLGVVSIRKRTAARSRITKSPTRTSRRKYSLRAYARCTVKKKKNNPFSRNPKVNLYTHANGIVNTFSRDIIYDNYDEKIAGRFPCSWSGCLSDSVTEISTVTIFRKTRGLGVSKNPPSSVILISVNLGRTRIVVGILLNAIRSRNTRLNIYNKKHFSKKKTV